MGRLDQQWDAWLDLTAELVRRPAATAMPHHEIQVLLAEQFECRTSFTSLRPDQSLSFDILGGAPTDDEEELDFWRREGPRSHPLIQWFARTGSTDPMTMGRVPTGWVAAEGRERVMASLRAVDLDEQLSIPCRAGAQGTWAFALGRTGDDFDDEALALAHRVQPLIVLVARQVVAVDGDPDVAVPADCLGLTGRELAVLRLLCEGHTGPAIAHRLGTAPATVRKHLENVYRKLGVHDRLMAYRVAQEAGLVDGAPGSDRTSA
jgi:DNA-binding CsgD family transcriptional regulator